MSEKQIKTGRKNSKKIILIILIIIVALAFAASAYAVISKIYQVNHKVKTGTVEIQDINLSIEDRLTGKMGDKITKWSPGDASLLTWDTVNVGTAAVRTRHTIQIYWNDSNIGDNAKDLLYMYPANMTNEEILVDFNGTKSKAIVIDRTSSIEIDGKNKIGISYMFNGDELDGTDKKGVAVEVNYDIEGYTTEQFTTKETNSTSDKIGFKILLSPSTPYLFQEKELSIKVITEALQYTEDGLEDWELQSVQTIN